MGMLVCDQDSCVLSIFAMISHVYLVSYVSDMIGVNENLHSHLTSFRHADEHSTVQHMIVLNSSLQQNQLFDMIL